MATMRTALSPVIVMLAAGCGGGGSGGSAAPVTVAPTPAPTPSPTPTPSPVALACDVVTANPTSLSPYSDPAFSGAIDNVRSFQWPTSLNACMDTARLRSFGIDPDNFYRDSAGRIVFSLRGGVVDDSNASNTTRMELRGTSFDATATGKVLEARFQLPAFADRSTAFTVSQIYGESDGLPIVRIAYLATRGSVTGHLWAYYRRGTGTSDATAYDLGPAPTEGDTGTVRLTYNTGGGIMIEASGLASPLQLTDNFGFWAATGKTAYFKAGCYLQDPGGCEVRFTSLRLDK